jgi:hypothetical protein
MFQLPSNGTRTMQLSAVTLVLHMRAEGPFGLGLPSGKRERGIQDGPRTSPKAVGPISTVSPVVVAAVKSNAAILYKDVLGEG